MLTLLMIFMAPALIFCCFKIIGLHRSETKYLQELYVSYQAALDEYKSDQQDDQKKDRCLELGREFYGKVLPGPYGSRLHHLYTQLDLNKEFLLYQDRLILKDLTLDDPHSESHSSENFPTIPLVS